MKINSGEPKVAEKTPILDEKDVSLCLNELLNMRLQLMAILRLHSWMVAIMYLCVETSKTICAEC